MMDNWLVIEEFLSYMAEHADQIWFASNMEICRYVQACRQLEFSAECTSAYNPTAADIWFDAGVWAAPHIIRIPSGETVRL